MSHWLPTPDQAEIAEAISSAITDALPLDRLHGEQASDRYRLGELAALGVLGMGIDEAAGGSGLSVVEEALVFDQLGYQLASPAVLASVIAAHGADDPAPFVMAEATAALAIALGDGLLVFDAEAEDAVVVLAGHTTRTLASSPALNPVADNPWRIDLHRGANPDATAKTHDELGLKARLLIASQLAGMSRRALDMAVDYAKIREQFGKPIGGFQAVKHHCANMAVASLAARDLVAFAATALEQNREDASFQIEAAILTAAKAARDNAGTNIQIHGGIGFSDECDAHLVLKQAQVWLALAGGEAAGREALLAQTSPLMPSHTTSSH